MINPNNRFRRNEECNIRLKHVAVRLCSGCLRLLVAHDTVEIMTAQIQLATLLNTYINPTGYTYYKSEVLHLIDLRSDELLLSANLNLCDGQLATKCPSISK